MRGIRTSLPPHLPRCRCLAAPAIARVFSEDGETFDVRFLADERYHSLTPLQPSKLRPYAWEEAPASLNKFLKRLAMKG